MLLKGDLSFAYKVYERLLKRISERHKLVEELVKATHDFTVKEYALTPTPTPRPTPRTRTTCASAGGNGSSSTCCSSGSATKPVPEAEAKQKVLTRYQGLLKRWKQLDNSDLLEIYLSDLTTSVDPHSIVHVAEHAGRFRDLPCV